MQVLKGFKIGEVQLGLEFCEVMRKQEVIHSFLQHSLIYFKITHKNTEPLFDTRF